MLCVSLGSLCRVPLQEVGILFYPREREGVSLSSRCVGWCVQGWDLDGFACAARLQPGEPYLRECSNPNPFSNFFLSVLWRQNFKEHVSGHLNGATLPWLFSHGGYSGTPTTFMYDQNYASGTKLSSPSKQGFCCSPCCSRADCPAIMSVCKKVSKGKHPVGPPPRVWWL